MAKTQTKLKQTASGKRANPFALVRDGQPLPAIATEKVRIAAPRRARSAHVQASIQPDCCPLCGVVIGRFDAEMFLSFGRCAPCHEALTEK